MEAFAEQVAGGDHAPQKLLLRREAAEDEVPELVLRAPERCVIRYRAVPFGPELPPFLNALTALGAQPEPSTASLDGPIELDVFITPDCPNCPRSVAARAVSPGS